MEMTRRSAADVEEAERQARAHEERLEQRAENAQAWRQKEREELKRWQWLHSEAGQAWKRDERKKEARRLADQARVATDLGAAERADMQAVREKYARRRAEEHVKLQRQWEKEGLLPKPPGP